MYSSVRKQLTSRLDTKNLSIESKQYRTVSKNTRSYSRSQQPQDDNNDREIRKQMTSNAYNSVFNRLVKIKDLKQFVRQSSQYVEFRQQQVQQYIVTGHNDKKRFSFSLKNSICSFLSRDYRFLKHYFTLLQKEFPEKADHLRHQIYYSYKDLVIDKKKFQSLFAPNAIFKSLAKSMAKSQQKINKSAKSLNKTNTKSHNKIEPHSNIEEGQIMGEKSNRKSRKTLNKKMDNQKQKSHKKITHTNQNFIKIEKNTLCKSKNLSKTKNNKVKLEQNIDPNFINSPQFSSKRRTTMQNIKLIEETLNEIETIFSNQNSQNSIVKEKQNNAPFSKNKSINKYQTPRFNKKSKIKKQESQLQDEEKLSKVDEILSQVQAQKKQRQLNQNINREDQTLQKLFAMRSNNKSKKKNQQDQDDDCNNQQIKSKKSKIKSSAKKDRKTVTFDQVFDINDPQNKALIQTVQSIRKQREIKKQAQIQKDKKANQILQKVRLSMSLSKTKKIWRPYDNKQRELLCPQQKDIVDLFEDIDAIGNCKDFIIDRNCNICGVLGQFNGFKVEYVLAWPQKGQEEDVFKALYLTKLQQSPSNEKGLNKLSINGLKNKISQTSTGRLTLLLIQK